MPRGIPKSGVRQYKSGKTVAVTGTKMQDKYVSSSVMDKIVHHTPVPSKFSVKQRFDFIGRFIELLADRKQHSMIITGDAGIGKSRKVVKTLESLGLEEIILDNDGDFVVIKGYSTARALYETLYTYNDKVIVMDDCDSIHRDPVASNIMKACLDSTDRRIVTWGAKIPESENLPTRFEFTGRMIFISNYSYNAFPQALVSRSFCVDLTLTVDEKIELVEYVFEDLNEDMRVVEFFKKNKHDLKDISVRSALSCLKLAKSMNDWEDLALYSLTLG